MAAMLAGCAGFGQIEQPLRLPAKPTLPSLYVHPDGGITLDRHDTERLMKYILELERGYE